VDLEREVRGQLLVDALVAAQNLVEGKDVTVVQEVRDLVNLDIIGEAREAVKGHLEDLRVLKNKGGDPFNFLLFIGLRECPKLKSGRDRLEGK